MSKTDKYFLSTLYHFDEKNNNQNKRYHEVRQMQQQLLIYIPELARALALSEAAIRSHVQRRHWPVSIPPPLRLGRRWAWRKQDVEEWLAILAGKPAKKETTALLGRPTKAKQIASRHSSRQE